MHGQARPKRTWSIDHGMSDRWDRISADDVSSRHQHRLAARSAPAPARARADAMAGAKRSEFVLVGDDHYRDGRRHLKLWRERKIERADAIASLVMAILTDFDTRVLAIDIETARHVAR